MMPVFAFSARRLKIAMPVVSEPVPEVVGHAMCGFTAPGNLLPGADRRVDVRHEFRRMARIEVRGLARVHHRAAAHRNVAVETPFGREARGVLERGIGGLDRDAIVDRAVDIRGGERRLSPSRRTRSSRCAHR